MGSQNATQAANMEPNVGVAGASAGERGCPKASRSVRPGAAKAPREHVAPQCSGPTSPGHHPLAASLSDTREVWGDFAFLIQPSFSQYSEHYSP